MKTNLETVKAYANTLRAEGLTTAQIARHLNKKGFTTTTGKKWTPSTAWHLTNRGTNTETVSTNQEWATAPWDETPVGTAGFTTALPAYAGGSGTAWTTTKTTHSTSTAEMVRELVTSNLSVTTKLATIEALTR